MEAGEDGPGGRERARGPEQQPLTRDRDAAANERDANAVDGVEEDGADQHGLEERGSSSR